MLVWSIYHLVNVLQDIVTANGANAAKASPLLASYTLQLTTMKKNMVMIFYAGSGRIYGEVRVLQPTLDPTPAIYYQNS